MGVREYTEENKKETIKYEYSSKNFKEFLSILDEIITKLKNKKILSISLRVESDYIEN